MSSLSLPLLTSDLWGYSLTKIYTGLCECCAKPVEDCKQASEQKGRDALKNRYDLLKVGTTGAGDIEGATEGLATVARVEDTPKLIDDPLGDAFEVRKELQVYLPPPSSPPSLISSLRRCTTYSLRRRRFGCKLEMVRSPW